MRRRDRFRRTFHAARLPRGVASCVVFRAWCVALLALCGLVDIGWSAPRIASLGVGVDGVYRADRWCPVEVGVADVTADSDVVLEVAAVDEGGRRIVYRSRRRLAARRENRLVQLVRLGASDLPIDVTLYAADEAPGERTWTDEQRFSRSEAAEPLAEDESLVLVVGRLPGLDAVDDAPGAKGRRAVYRQLTSLAQLPAAGTTAGTTGESPATVRTLALDAVETVVWLAGQASESAEEDSLDDAVATLDGWVRGGGRLIVGLGPHVAASPPLRERLARLGIAIEDQAIELRQLGPLEAILGDAAVGRGKPNAAAAEAFRLPLVKFEARDETVVAKTAQTAGAATLLARAPRGFGEIVVVAFDLGDSPLVAWPQHARLLSTILALGESASASLPTEDRAAAWSGKGYTSLDEQLADVLDQFPGASPARFWYLAAAVVVYALVIGPVDWYLVRRRPEWTWATFLGSVAVASIGGYAIVTATKAETTLVNQLGIVDVDLTMGDTTSNAAARSGATDAARSARVRGHAWSCIYQPAAEVGDLRVQPPRPWRTNDASHAAADDPAVWLSLWQRPANVAGDSLLRREGNDAALIADAQRGAIGGLTAAAWSSQFAAATWMHETRVADTATLQADVFGRVVGHMHNPLDEPLEQAVLFYGTFALSLGKLAPGQSVAIDGRGDWRSAESYLTRQRLGADRDTAERYDATGLELDRIGEVIGFYEATGGRQYVGLDRQGFERLDLSPQLRLGRAVFIGKTASGAGVLLTRTGRRGNNGAANDADRNDAAPAYRQTTWWRFLIRVADSAAPAS